MITAKKDGTHEAVYSFDENITKRDIDRMIIKLKDEKKTSEKQLVNILSSISRDTNLRERLNINNDLGVPDETSSNRRKIFISIIISFLSYHHQQLISKHGRYIKLDENQRYFQLDKNYAAMIFKTVGYQPCNHFSNSLEYKVLKNIYQNYFAPQLPKSCRTFYEQVSLSSSSSSSLLSSTTDLASTFQNKQEAESSFLNVQKKYDVINEKAEEFDVSLSVSE